MRPSKLPAHEVLRADDTEYFHLEVLATVPSRTASRAGKFLIDEVGRYLLTRAKCVTTSPITGIGHRLCKYFEFQHISDEELDGTTYPIYYLEIDGASIESKLKRF